MANPVEQTENERDLRAFEEHAAKEAIPYDEFLAQLKEADII